MDIETKRFQVNSSELIYYPLKQFEERGYKISKYPYSIKVLIENVARNLDGKKITQEDLESILKWEVGKELAIMPTRVLLQDYTGVPLIVDLAAMRSEVKRRGIDPKIVNPIIPSDLIVDHSIQVDYFGTKYAFYLNLKTEYERNKERYMLLKWAKESFSNLRIVPPGNGIIHQVNLEYLSKVISSENVRGNTFAFPELVIGTDSHTTMANGLSVLSWGVGGLEAEAVMLGEPYYMTVPEVIGVKIVGEIKEGTTPTDVVLFITETLRKKGVVGKFVEFFGPSLSLLSVPDRATIANMSPEYGATAAYFPIDDQTLEYLKNTARSTEIVEKYVKLQGLFYSYEPLYSDVVEIDLSEIEPSLAGPRNPDERIPLSKVKEEILKIIQKKRKGKFVEDGSVAIASITSCTNTSNPTVMLGAGILAKKAVELGLRVKPYVKTSIAPGSTVVTEYLKNTGLMPYLEALGFHIVGYGCTTCIGNSGPLLKQVEADVIENKISVFGVISGNRNFEGRINPYLRGTFLASPILVVTYAIAGSLDIDLYNEPISYDSNGMPVYLKDIWPKLSEIKQYINHAFNPELYKIKYERIFEGDENWNTLNVERSDVFKWDENSTFIKEPPWLTMKEENVGDIKGARILLLLGDKITTDHISPAGPIQPESPAGKYLLSLGVKDLNTYGSRRGNHEVMLRGGFANPKLKNYLVEVEGGYTKHLPDGQILTVYEASEIYKKENVPLVIVAGKQYGSGSSRDWAAKVTKLLGVRAVLAESFERIHRSNLVAMGVLPIQIKNWKELGIKGDEIVNIYGLDDIRPKKEVSIEFIGNDGNVIRTKGILMIETEVEVNYIKHGNILKYVLNKMIQISNLDNQSRI